ncbi:MAG: hypothetical protein IT579_25195 [Verrucomicrobia subdivision 3 bacterium]|nr:hypothetical protein [Limisphaerales bacterium]
MSGLDRIDFLNAVFALDGLPPSDDVDAARWVASGLHGISRGMEDAGDMAGAAVVRFAGAALVRDLATGRWREDVLRERLAAAPREVTT